MNEDTVNHEQLVQELKDDRMRADYARPYDTYKTGMLASILGWLLVAFGTLVYGSKPSYAKFKAIEVIARIPYQSWEVAAYTLVSAFHGNEGYAMRLARTAAFARAAQDNETMHVVVISHLAKKHCRMGIFRHALIPLIFAFFYFWAIYLLYMISRRASLELNYLFESHAYAQYDRFLKENTEHLHTEPLMSEFLSFYGRECRSEYEFFETVRNDELVHRNRSVREIEAYKR